ncbi:MAG: hypothetical protein WCL53_07345 [Chloroflexota bacterium]
MPMESDVPHDPARRGPTRQLTFLREESPAGEWIESLDGVILDLIILRSNGRELRELIARRQDRVWLDALWNGSVAEGEVADLSLEVARLLANFVAAFSALADHSMVHVNGWTSSFLGEYRSRLHDEITSAPSFELLRVLRNRAQHVRPVTPVARVRFSSGDEPTAWLSWYLPKQWLLGIDEGWSESLRSFLDRTHTDENGRVDLLADLFSANDVDIDWLASDYMERASAFTLWVYRRERDHHREELQLAIHEIAELEGRLAGAGFPVDSAAGHE